MPEASSSPIAARSTQSPFCEAKIVRTIFDVFVSWKQLSLGVMRIILLGTAAGGGLPQWNCNCPNCREARAGSTRVVPRTQSSAAVSADGQAWFLLNASPDLRVQLESAPRLHPRTKAPRSTRIEAVLLT